MSKKYQKETKILDEVYSEIVEAILNKPELEDYELSRIYFENVAARMNKWAELVNKAKKSLESKEEVNDITADNRPA